MTPRRILLFLAAAFLVPLATHALWWWSRPQPRSWSDADWSSAGILPSATAIKAARVHVLAGRAGRWKGVVAHHTWIVVKPAGADRYTRFDVVGWGRPVRIDAYAADGRWYGDTPRILLTLEGAAAEAAIPAIRTSVVRYPYREPGSYMVWPGPNSNSFVAHIARAVPALAPALLPTAIGKDFPPGGWLLGRTPSGTGLQLLLGGGFGLTVAWVEGLELNILGLVTGLDVRRPAIKLPGWGRIGWPPG